MYEDLTWKERFKKEIDKIKEMEPKMRWNYFVTYYMWKTLLILAALVMVIHISYDMRMSFRDPIASGCMVNISADIECEDFLTDSYLKYKGANPKKSVCYLTMETTHFMEDNPMDQDSYEMAFTAQLFAGQYTYMLLDKDALAKYESMDIFADLKKTLSEEQYDVLSSDLVFRDVEGARKAVAIDISDAPFVDKYHLAPDKVYLAFVDVKQDVEKNQQFLAYLLEEN